MIGRTEENQLSILKIRGIVSLLSTENPVAGVTVIARIAVGAFPNTQDGLNTPLQLGRAVTDSAGVFEIETDDADPEISRWVCLLQNCSDFQFTLACFDNDETLLHETQSMTYSDELVVEIALPDPDFTPSADDWAELSRRMMDSQTVRLGALAVELVMLAPQGVFKDWSVTRRLGVLIHLEQALLDPENLLGISGTPVRFLQLASDGEIQRLQDQFRLQQRMDLLEALDVSLERARAFGSLREVNAFVDAGALLQADVFGGVNAFLNERVGIVPDVFPWLVSPLIGYRDYLRDLWIKNQPKFQGDNIDPAIILQRLNHRFHQNFATKDQKDRLANRVLMTILLEMLSAATGPDYGFGIAAAAIEPQGERSEREYLDYLISLSGLQLEEVEKRYRLNLKRSDLEHSNPVQQNIDTLQRFFTDSYQSIADPLPIKPDRVMGTEELLIIEFPAQGSGPFFLEYEEWLERETPFYPENHYDPRATFYIGTGKRDKALDDVNANSMPVLDFLNEKLSTTRFIPRAGYDHRAAKWQWVRNLLEIQDLLKAGDAELKGLNFVGAEDKYAAALGWVTKMRDFITSAPAGWWNYDPAAVAKDQKKVDVSDMGKLMGYERKYHQFLGWHYGIIPEYGDILKIGGKPDEISEKWWGNGEGPGHKQYIAYLIDYLLFRHIPACLSEAQQLQGKYAEAVRVLIEPASFHIFAAAADAAPFAYPTNGPLPYGSSSDRTVMPATNPPTKAATNRAELGYFMLKLGNATLEWADTLYRSNQPENIMRARELYKAVLFLHGEDPEITPTWNRRLRPLPRYILPGWKSNPAVVGQVNRARIGFLQINAGLNYYAISPTHVPPVRYCVLKEAADRFAAGARGAQTDFLNYTQQLDQLTVSEMTARTMVAKANSAISIAQEQQKLAEFNVGEVQKQVDAIQGQIAAKRAEIAKADEFFEQVKVFAGGMKDSVSKLGEVAFADEGAGEAASAQTLSSGDVMKLAMKFGSSGGDMTAATGALGSSMAVAGPFAAFLYAGVTSMTGLAAAAARRSGELNALEKVALPAAKALVDLKKREVTIAQLTQAIARADWQLGNDLLTYYASRLLNRSFLVNLSEFSNRLMRRYLDLAGRMAWSAERALAFEQDRQLGVIGFDYFPRNLRGVTGADLLQLHLAELEAARIQGLTQTVPVKQTISLARDYPIQFGQLKKTGLCRFNTTETPLRLVHPGVYGYRVRNVTVAATYADPIQPHRGMLTNQGVSLVTRNQLGTAHILLRYPDALPLSEFRMRNDMWVFDLPDETLLPFEGSGIETVWELMLSKIGNANSFESLTDILITFDMRASYSAFLERQHIAALPNSANRSLLVSGKTMNPGKIAAFHKDGGQLVLNFDLAKLARNPSEMTRTTLNFTLVVVGVDDAPFSATFSSVTPPQDGMISFEKGVALSNAGALADGNGGVPLPLNTFVNLVVDQPFTLSIDAAANPGMDFTQLSEVLLLVEYEATF